MKAAVWTGPGQPIEVEELVPLPLGRRDVRVRVGASGVCVTDAIAAGGSLPLRSPHVLGHAASGVVVEVGEEVRHVGAGDRVLVSVAAECGECRWCLEGRPDQCWSMPLEGAERYRRADGTAVTSNSGVGSFAEELVANEAQVVAIAAEVPDRELTLLGCGATAGLGAALVEAPVRAGSAVAVLGCGPVGLSYLQGARIAGAGKIIAVDPIAERRELALELGASVAFDPLAEEPVEAGEQADPYLRPAPGFPTARVRELTGGLGADYVFEATADSGAMTESLSMARRGGDVILSSFPADGLEATLAFSAVEVAANDRTIHGCQLGRARLRSDVPRFASLLEDGAFDATALIARDFGLDGVGEALQAAADRAIIGGVVVPAVTAA